MIGGLAIGALAWGLGSAVLRGGGRMGPRVVARDPTCSVSILAYRAGQRSLIDAHSGRAGYSHVALQGCEISEAGPVVLDCRPGRGVVRVPVEAARGAELIPLPIQWAAETYGCARASVGRPYTIGHDGAVCSAWIYGCLPLEAQRWIDRWADLAIGGVPSPNQIVVALRALSP